VSTGAGGTQSAPSRPSVTPAARSRPDPGHMTDLRRIGYNAAIVALAVGGFG
jgi:hypothetical protein